MGTLKVDTVVGSDGTSPVTLTGQYTVKVWVNFDGTVSTPAVRESGNVSSITDIDLGRYYVNFASALTDTNYIGVHSGGNSGGGSGDTSAGATTDYTTTQLRMTNEDVDAGSTDFAIQGCIVVR